MKLILQEVVGIDHMILEAGIIQVSCICLSAVSGNLSSVQTSWQLLCEKTPLFLWIVANDKSQMLKLSVHTQMRSAFNEDLFYFYVSVLWVQASQAVGLNTWWN